MEEIGIVKQVSGAFATIVIQKKSACEQCTAGCKVSDSEAEIEALNHAQASIGQKVRVELKAASYLKGSIIVYGLPALALVGGAIIGKEILSGFFAADPDIISAIAGFSAFIASFGMIRWWSSHIGKSTEHRPVVMEILE